MGQAAIEMVGPADIDRARVAVVIGEAADEAAARVIRAVRRDGVPRVVLVAARFEEAGVVACVAAGATSFMRRSEATSARLTEVIREADERGCQLPEGLVRKATRVLDKEVPGRPFAQIDLRERPRVTVTTRLGARETAVMRLVAQGYDTTEIAERLSFSESTIKGVLAKLMTRLDARNRCHAVAIVVKEGLI
jgi:DNA-binding NarL/FixJ family response regulator